MMKQDRIALTLPKEDGVTLYHAIQTRRSSRAFVDRPLEQREISELLWAAYGVTDSEGRRTAPTARGCNELNIYLFTHEGVWKYEPLSHSLSPMLKGDHRKVTGLHDFVALASINIVYTADLTIAAEGPRERQIAWASIAVGAMSQNASLWANSHNLLAVVRGAFEAQPIADLLQLPQSEPIILTQSIGRGK
jgi:hypothetical protein